MAAQEVLHPGVQKEAQKNLPRMTEHHDEGHQRPPRAADLEMAKVAPVDLPLFAREAEQTQIGFGLRTRPITGDEVAEVIGAARIAAFARHPIQTAGRQRRECLQRLTDEWQIGVDRRFAWGPNPRQTGLRQHAPHHVVMHVQLTGDRADGPLLGVIIAQDLRLDIRWRHHGRVPSACVAARRDDRRGGAKIPGGRDRDSAGRTSGSARSVAGVRHPRSLRRSRSSASRTTENHREAVGVNPDASRFCIAPGIGARARHA